VRALLADERPDVVVGDYAWPAAAAAPLLAEHGLPFVISGRGSDVLQVAGEAGLGDELAAHLRRAGHWIGVSRHLVDAMDELAGAPGRGRLVPNGVDTELFAPVSREQARTKLGRAPGERLVLVVGHLIPRKDPLLALETLHAIAPELRATLRGVFIGRGPLEDAVRARAKELGLAERIELVGEQPPERLATWYSAADVLLLTSSREGRPNVVLEALACGTPVLATDAGGTRELLAGLDGMLATSREPAQLARELEALFRREPDREALRRHVAPLSWSASLETLEACLRDALAAGSAP
jgi:glycosyltransferase involved in cell wall biosynthesis